MKIVVLDGNTLTPGELSYEPLREFGEYTVYAHSAPLEEAVSHIGDAEIILTNKVPITRELLERCPSIRYIGCQSTGYNVVDLDACRERGIPVTNVPTYGTAAVAQFTMALLLELCHRVGLHSDHVRSGAWSECGEFCFWETPQTELAGKTFGVIGFGRIGRAAGALAKAFGMRVLAFSRSRCPEGAAIGEYVDLDTLLRESDVISLHCPLFPETEKIINAENLSKMKPGVMLLNTSRGGLIDESALTQALTAGRVAGAAVDVLSSEPPAEDNPLLTAPNCLITPHMAWAPQASRQRLLDTVISNIRAFLQGSPENVVN